VAEVLSNLLTNALKHTPTGGHVSVSVTGEPHGGVMFTVEDTGPGIGSDVLPFVFDRFTTSAGTDGTGLGLAIAKRLVEAHGGTITASSDANGTMIRCTFPAREDR
jgi:two-component system sensor histidine kinase ResE